MKKITFTTLVSCVTLFLGMQVSLAQQNVADKVAVSELKPHTNQDVIAMMQGNWQCETFFEDEDMLIIGKGSDTITGDRWKGEGEMVFTLKDTDEVPPLKMHVTGEVSIDYKDNVLHETGISLAVIKSNEHPLADMMKKLIEADIAKSLTFSSKVMSITQHQFVTEDIEDGTVVSCKRAK